MLKNKTILMLITGVVLAVVLWSLVQLFQAKRTETVPINPSANTNLKNTAAITASTSDQYANAPASVLSAQQASSVFTVTGKGVPGAGISIRNNTLELARTKVSGEGDWTLSFSSDSTNGTLALDFLTVTPDGHQIRSDQSLFVIRNPHKPAVEKERQASGSALLLLTAPGAHSRVLQSPYIDLPQINGFALEAIDYDNSGGVIFSGSSNKSGKVRIYAGTNLVGESHVDNQGRWSLIFGNIMPLGEYNISAELVLSDGETIKLTLPFARMQPLFEVENSPKILVEHLDDRIQIGRALLGGGYQYSVIYAPIALEE